MKLSAWCREKGISYKAGWNMFKSGKLPFAEQLPTGTIIINEPKKAVADKEEKHVVYARVSSSEQAKTNLITQAERVSRFIEARGNTVSAVVKEVGSGLNDNRPLLLKLLNDPTVSHIYVEHKDRLTRFGFNYIKTLCDHRNVEIVIVNEVEDDEADIMQDFVSLVTSFCTRLYGSRRSKHKTERIIRELTDEDPEN